MKNEEWGNIFKIWGRNRQLDAREDARYESYKTWCKEIWRCKPADEQIWRGVLSKLTDV